MISRISRGDRNSRTAPPSDRTSAPPEASAPNQAGQPNGCLPVGEAACLTGLFRDLLCNEMRRRNLTHLKVTRAGAP